MSAWKDCGDLGLLVSRFGLVFLAINVGVDSDLVFCRAWAWLHSLIALHRTVAGEGEAWLSRFLGIFRKGGSFTVGMSAFNQF
jgi:hypothetical protein